jgi:outer membrane receptor protein involved in Fe transport
MKFLKKRLSPSRTEKYTTSNTGTPPWSGRLGIKFDRDFDRSVIFHSNVYLEWASLAKETVYDTSALLPNSSGNPATYEYGFVTNKMPGWATLNVDLGLEYGEEHKWTVALSLRNIFDRQYTRATNVIEEPGFHAVLGVGFEF